MPFSFPLNATDTSEESLLPSARRLCTWTQWAAIIAGLSMGLSNLVIWIAGSGVLPGFMVMRMNTALGVTAAALSLALWQGSSSRVSRVRLAQALAVAASLIGGLTAAQDLRGVNLGIDQLFSSGTFPGDTGSAFVVHPGRMSLNAALSLFFIGLSLLGLDWCVPVRSRKFYPAPALALVAALPSTLAIVGYLLGIGTFTGLLRSTNILLHTALALFALSIGVLAARPERPPMRHLLSTGADGVLLRWMLPSTVSLLLVLGWAIERGMADGMVVPREGTALMLYGGLVLLSGLLVAASRALNRQETRARRANLALREGQERSRAIVNTALDAVLVMDVEGRIAEWNPAAERIFGWPREEVLGQALAERIIPERLRAAHYRGLARLLETSEGPVLGQRLEISAVRRDGTEFPVELSINPLPNADRSLFVGFIRDITDRQAAEDKLRAAKEAAESASRAKDNFLAALSHELRTPLSPVLMTAAALREDQRLPGEVREQMAMMERNIGLEARLIDDLLDLTRLTRGKLPMRTEHCEAHSLLSHAVEIVRDEAQAKGVTLELELAARRSGLLGDPARLQQVFWNLLKNAVKFTPSGGRIRVRTHDHLTANGRLVLEVSDTGMGFAPDAAEHIFTPFEQAGRERDHRFGGLGLGLAIAQAIVDLHGGVIHAASAGLGCGSTFTVELPGATEPPDDMVADAQLTLLPDEGATALRLLVVEDHEPTLTVLTRLLTRAGHKVASAGTVADALAAAEVSGFDAVISDLGLPDGTGLELMVKLRHRTPRLRGIALTGYGMEDDLLRSREAGFSVHLVKPVDFEQLRRALRELQDAR